MLATLKHGQNKSPRRAPKSDIRIPVSSGRPGSLDTLLHEVMSTFGRRQVFILLVCPTGTSLFTGEECTESQRLWQFIKPSILTTRPPGNSYSPVFLNTGVFCEWLLREWQSVSRGAMQTAVLTALVYRYVPVRAGSLSTTGETFI